MYDYYLSQVVLKAFMFTVVHIIESGVTGCRAILGKSFLKWEVCIVKVDFIFLIHRIMALT